MLAWHRSARLKNVQSDPEPAPGGALAPRPAAPLAETNATLTGGAGPFDHSARDPLAPSAGMWTGIVGVVRAVAVAVVFARKNPRPSCRQARGQPQQPRHA